VKLVLFGPHRGAAPEIPDLDILRRYADAGVHRLVLQPSTMDGVEMGELITTAGDTLIGRT
jgi:hypothetical protein